MELHTLMNKEQKIMSKNNKLLSKTNDLIFKSIFGDYKHKHILSDFLQSILDLPKEEYDKIELLDPHSKTVIAGDKECVLDIKLHTKSGKVIDVEVQVRRSPVMRQRVVYYAADMLREQLRSGDQYEKLQKVICIVIAVKHKLITEDKHYYHKYQLHDRRTDSTFSDLIEVNTLELMKLPKKSDNTKMWKWMKFLQTDDEEEIEVLTQGNVAMQEAVCVLKELSADEQMRMLVQSREKFIQDQEARELEEFQKGLERGKQQGLVEGEKNKAIEIVKNLIKLNFDIEKISEITGLTERKINEVK